MWQASNKNSNVREQLFFRSKRNVKKLANELKPRKNVGGRASEPRARDVSPVGSRGFFRGNPNGKGKRRRADST